MRTQAARTRFAAAMLVTKLAMNSATRLDTWGKGHGMGAGTDEALTSCLAPGAPAALPTHPLIRTHAQTQTRVKHHPLACGARLEVRLVGHPRVRVLPGEDEAVADARDGLHAADEVPAVAVLPGHLGEVQGAPLGLLRLLGWVLAWRRRVRRGGRGREGGGGQPAEAVGKRWGEERARRRRSSSFASRYVS